MNNNLQKQFKALISLLPSKDLHNIAKKNKQHEQYKEITVFSNRHNMSISRYKISK